MALYLLGIPLAIASAKLLHDDVKYTAMNLRIDNASHDVNVQYRQIEENFVDILKYSGANCDFKKISYGDYEIKNVQKGQYGGMERYLAEKGFYSEAIDYAKKLFDDIANKEHEIKSHERDERINKYERDLRFNETYYDIFKISRKKYTPQGAVEQNVQKMIDYFNEHGQNDVHCNIIMGGSAIYHNHTEVWNMKIPTGVSNREIQQYMDDVYDKIITNNLEYERDQRIRNFEQKVQQNVTRNALWESRFSENHSREEIEKNIEIIINYLKKHGQENISIVMKKVQNEHVETWNLKVPIEATDDEISQYLADICDKIIIWE